MAGGYDATAAQLALAWVLAKGEFIVPIPGASKIAHLEQNCVAADLALRHADVATLDEWFSEKNILGERYNDSEFVLVDR
jgi:aryl-alcohol dehydrogenase-like predicted oxidoreductase|nr:aldo/keto reductase [Pantoea leporis]